MVEEQYVTSCKVEAISVHCSCQYTKYGCYLVVFETEAIGQQGQTTPVTTRALRRLFVSHPLLIILQGQPGPPSSLMKRTRRQTKRQEAAAAAAEPTAEPAAESISASASAPDAASQLIVIPDDIDTEFLSNLIPDVNLESPSPDAIVALYRLVQSHSADLDATQREVEELKAEVEKREVELDQALQDKETATKDLESSLEAAQNELRQVKQEKDELGMCCIMILPLESALYSIFIQLPPETSSKLN